VHPDNAFPPYRAGQLIWAENLLGGLMFGVGMTFASGCGNKCLVRIGGGNLKSIMVMLIIAVIACYMINPFPGSDQTLFTLLFYNWIRPLAVNLCASQDLGAMVSSESPNSARLFIGGLISLLLLGYALKSAEFRGSFDRRLLTFGVMAFPGVIAGSLLWSLLSRSFRFEWFISFSDFAMHLVGAVLMGFGGVLAMGCTIGQGITGVSTLAVGSFITFIAIVLGSTLTMKVQYYKLVYE